MKILALEKEVPGVKPEDFQPHLIRKRKSFLPELRFYRKVEDQYRAHNRICTAMSPSLRTELDFRTLHE